MGVILPDGDGGDPGGIITPPSGGGGGSSSPTPINLANLPVTGGLAGFNQALLVPGFDDLAQVNLFYVIDPTDFNCEEDVEYDFKLEEIVQGNDVTVHNVLIRYRDLGIVRLTVYISSTDIDKTVVKDITLGTSNADGKLHTYKVDMKGTMEAPQLKIIRRANNGPLCITKVIGEVSYGTGDVI